jgi:hypothetical protein
VFFIRLALPNANYNTFFRILNGPVFGKAQVHTTGKTADMNGKESQEDEKAEQKTTLY